MKKYINGKLYEMTEKDTIAVKYRYDNSKRDNRNTSDYEERVKELENTVATLLTKLSEVEQ